MSSAPSIGVCDASLLLTPVRLGRWPLPLARRWVLFSDLPLRMQHPMRLTPADRDALASLQRLGEPGVARWHRRRSRAWLAALPEAERRLPAMTIGLCQLVLLEIDELQALASMCAGVQLSSLVKTCIDRDDVTRLRRALGESAYRFAVRDAQRYLSNRDAPLAGGSGVTGSNAAGLLASAIAPHTSRLPQPSVEAICLAAEHAGWLLIRAGVDGALANAYGAGQQRMGISEGGDAAHASAAIRQRFVEKLPPDPVAPFAWQTMPPTTEAFTLVSKMIHYLGFPWLSSFNALQ